MKIKVNGSIPGFTKEQIVEVETDEDGTPLEFLWRRRLKDAKVDNCCEVIKPQAKITNRPKRVTERDET